MYMEVKKKTNLYNFVIFSLKIGFWIKCSNQIMFNFINVNDVSQVVKLIISKYKISKNKTYIVSDDFKQSRLYKNYQNFFKRKIIKIPIPLIFVKFIIYFFPLPKKIVNFLLIVSSRVSYSNKIIKKELNFKPELSLYKNIKLLNEKKI